MEHVYLIALMGTIYLTVNVMLAMLIALDAHHHQYVKVVYLVYISIMEIASQVAHPQALLLLQVLALLALM